MTPILWTELWNRAEREEIGIAVQLADVSHNKAVNLLHIARPPHMRNWTACATPDPLTFFIIRDRSAPRDYGPSLAVINADLEEPDLDA